MLELLIYFRGKPLRILEDVIKKVPSDMKFNIYLKIHSPSWSPPFTEFIERGINRCVEIPKTFFCLKLE